MAFQRLFGSRFQPPPQSNRASYGTACLCNMSVRNICVFLFVNCVFIFRIANTFLALYAMKYSEIFFVIRKFLAYTPPPQLYMLATALGRGDVKAHFHSRKFSAERKFCKM
jgi:hypothetical protein